jgi:hypothetical protein
MDLGRLTVAVNSLQLQELGIEPRSEAEALVDMARTLIGLGVAKPTFS